MLGKGSRVEWLLGRKGLCVVRGQAHLIVAGEKGHGVRRCAFGSWVED